MYKSLISATFVFLSATQSSLTMAEQWKLVLSHDCGANVSDVSLSPDGKSLAVAFSHERIAEPHDAVVIDIEDAVSIPLNINGARNVGFTSDPTRLLVGLYQKTHIVDLEKRSIQFTVQGCQPKLSRDAKWFWTIECRNGSGERASFYWMIESGIPIKYFRDFESFRGARSHKSEESWNDQISFARVANKHEKIELFDFSTGKRILDSDAYALEQLRDPISFDGKFKVRIWFGAIEVHDLNSGEIVHQIETTRSHLCVAPNTYQFAATVDSKMAGVARSKVFVEDYSTKARIHELLPDVDMVTCIDWSANGQLIAVGTLHGDVHVWAKTANIR